MTARTALDPILAPALELEQLPLIPARRLAYEQAEVLTGSIELLGRQLAGETDPGAQGQLANSLEALAVIVVNLVAYSRGRTPKVGSKKPNTNIVLS